MISVCWNDYIWCKNKFKMFCDKKVRKCHERIKIVNLPFSEHCIQKCVDTMMSLKTLFVSRSLKLVRFKNVKKFWKWPMTELQLSSWIRYVQSRFRWRWCSTSCFSIYCWTTSSSRCNGRYGTSETKHRAKEVS